nr:guanylate kinase [Bacilli bacterium]
MIPEVFIQFDPSDKHDRKGCFFVLSGPSGVGKNTLVNLILKEMRGIYYVPSVTTRAMRPGESQMNPYAFVSVEQFEDMIEKEQFLEWKKIHNNSYYGTHMPTILFAIDNGYDIITDMDVLGCQDAILRIPERIYTIFVLPPSMDELSNRLLERDADTAAVKQRLERVPLELGHKDRYDFTMINDNLEQSVNELRSIIQSVVEQRSE